MIFQRILPQLLLLLHRVVFMPLALLFAVSLGLIFSSKIREGFSLRIQARRERKPPLKNPLWIHVSSGEFEYAKALIPKLKQEFQSPLLVTYYSPSYRKPIEEHPLVDLALPLPLDFAGACSSFLHRHKPKAILIARTDLWPELLTQCQRKNIPRFIFSSRTVDPKLLSYFSYWTYQLLTHIFCVNEENLEHFKKLHIPPEKVTVCGDTRFDQVFERLNTPPSDLKTELFSSKPAPLMIAGSTWPKDEKILIDGLSVLLKEQRLRLVIVPHEPTLTHINDLKQRLKKQNLDYGIYSEANEWSSTVLIVDQKGVLANLYPYGDLAFVGNSFMGQVHSVMEPLAAGCVSFVGPKHLKSPESVEFKSYSLDSETFMVNEVSEMDLKDKIEKTLNNYKSGYKTQIQAQVKKNLGASDRLIAEIKKLI